MDYNYNWLIIDNQTRFWEVSWSHVYNENEGKNETQVVPTLLRQNDVYIEVRQCGDDDGSSKTMIVSWRNEWENVSWEVS